MAKWWWDRQKDKAARTSLEQAQAHESHEGWSIVACGPCATRTPCTLPLRKPCAAWLPAHPVSSLSLSGCEGSLRTPDQSTQQTGGTVMPWLKQLLLQPSLTLPQRSRRTYHSALNQCDLLRHGKKRAECCWRGHCASQAFCMGRVCRLRNARRQVSTRSSTLHLAVASDRGCNLSDHNVGNQSRGPTGANLRSRGIQLKYRLARKTDLPADRLDI